MKNQVGRRVEVLRIDNELELYFKEFHKFYLAEGVSRNKIIAYNPQQNSLAERMYKDLA